MVSVVLFTGSGVYGQLSLAHIPITTDIKKGTKLVSSGFGIALSSRISGGYRDQYYARFGTTLYGY